MTAHYRIMSHWRTYLFSVYFLHVIVVFVLSRSAFCSATNDSTFVNASKSPLRILGVFGHYGKSHFEMFKPLVEELARRGHHVTIISHFPRSESAKAKEPLPTYKDISIVDLEHGIHVNVIDLRQIRHNIVRLMQELMLLRFLASVACKAGLNHPAVKEFLRSDEKFDLILTESFNTDCFLGFVHRFKVPYISLSSHHIVPWLNDDMGNEDNPSYIPSIFVGLSKPMDFPSRLFNTLTMMIAKMAYNYWFRFHDQIIANEVFGPDLPSLKEIAKQTQASLVNTHFSLHGIAPTLPNIVEIGGIHIPSRVNPLPKDIAEFLDNAHEGVIYFNMGSMIKTSTMPPEKLEAIVNVFSSIPYKVLWKWESDVLPRKLDNVMARKWLPQFDALSK